MKHALAAVLALALTACGQHAIKPATTEPVPAQCDAKCYTPCDVTAPAWSPVDANDPKAWDLIGTQVVAPLRDQRDRCELHRQACTQCLERLERAGVIRN